MKYEATPMATVLEAQDIATILNAVELSHEAFRSMGADASRHYSGQTSVWTSLERLRELISCVKGS